MPSLQELAWVVPITSKPPVNLPRSRGHPRFPSLKRLYLGHPLTFEMSQFIANQCPRLLYLRNILRNTHCGALQAAFSADSIADYEADTNPNGQAVFMSKSNQSAKIYFAAPYTVIQHLVSVSAKGVNTISGFLEARGLKDAELKKLIEPRVKLVHPPKGQLSARDGRKDRITGGEGNWAFRECNFDDCVGVLIS
ncbi:hypothetical protein BDN72DRAFT_330557 [Pluteus cervinus]|uniref:Uncharacterized protein n=1 Tax=Pluteus cervinus TaxID=181527 RepID=A0ACD3ACD5_9AGAR|nr:hypothetical protein BDN72DRAFT_330557 [Pluteus cervinus]